MVKRSKGNLLHPQYKLSMDATWISTSEQRELMWIRIDSLTSGAQYDVRIIAKNGNTLTEVREGEAREETSRTEFGL